MTQAPGGARADGAAEAVSSRVTPSSGRAERSAPRPDLGPGKGRVGGRQVREGAWMFGAGEGRRDVNRARGCCLQPAGKPAAAGGAPGGAASGRGGARGGASL